MNSMKDVAERLGTNVKLSPSERMFERTLTDRSGAEVVVRIIIDEGHALDRVIQRLANKIRNSKTQRIASAADGVIRVSIVRDPTAKKT